MSEGERSVSVWGSDFVFAFLRSGVEEEGESVDGRRGGGGTVETGGGEEEGGRE